MGLKDITALATTKIKEADIVASLNEKPKKIKKDFIDNRITEEDYIFTDFVLKNPIIEDFSKKMQLLNPMTGSPIKVVDKNGKPAISKNDKANDIAKTPLDLKVINKLQTIADKTMEDHNHYTKEDIINNIIKINNISEERAIKGFDMLFESGIIGVMPIGEYYYKSNTTPF